MDIHAVKQAKLRLIKAEKALAIMQAAKTLDDTEEAWTDFLIAAATIYSKLEQGSKQNPISKGWYERKKGERRKDPLLRYLHFARNSNEHGIERVVESTGENRDALTGRKLEVNERVPTTVQQVDPITGQTFGPISKAVMAGPSLRPMRAHDRRFNDYCDPPETHLGQPLEFMDFADVLAEAAMPYLRKLVGDAEALTDVKASTNIAK
jgi:hypothetical protein